MTTNETSQDAKNDDNKEDDTDIDTNFNEELQKIQKELNISEENVSLFKKIVNTNPISRVPISTLFDFFKLEKYLNRKYISPQFSEKIKQTPNINWVKNKKINYNLLIFDKSVQNAQQREVFNDFLKFTKILDCLKMNIHVFFHISHIEEYSHELILEVLNNMEPESIPQDDLIEYFLKKPSNRQQFLSFIDLKKASKDKKEGFLLLMFEKYVQLTKSNIEYGKVLKGLIKMNDKNDFLKKLSEKGNVIASYELYSMFKKTENKADMNQYLEKCREMKQFAHNISKILSNIQNSEVTEASPKIEKKEGHDSFSQSPQKETEKDEITESTIHQSQTLNENNNSHQQESPATTQREKNNLQNDNFHQQESPTTTQREKDDLQNDNSHQQESPTTTHREKNNLQNVNSHQQESPETTHREKNNLQNDNSHQQESPTKINKKKVTSHLENNNIETKQSNTNDYKRETKNKNEDEDKFYPNGDYTFNRIKKNNINKKKTTLDEYGDFYKRHKAVPDPSPFNPSPNQRPFNNNPQQLRSDREEVIRNERIKPNSSLQKHPATEISRFTQGKGNIHNHRQQKMMSFTKIELQNQQIWKETEKIISQGFYNNNYKIKQKVEESNRNTQTFKYDFNFEKYFNQRFRKKSSWGSKEKRSIFSKIEVTQEGTFEAARRIKSENIREVCALNFASATKPGGGVKNGRTAQEESLSRQSSLYFSLITQNEMYEYHKNHPNPFYTDYMIYSPNVVVIRDEQCNLTNPIRVSVITSAAVNKSEILKRNFQGEKDEIIRKYMKQRIRKILQLCILSNNRAIILGAFGCGVFGNEPEIISKIFKEIIVDEFYGLFIDRIIFAIKGKPGKYNPNYEAFKATFNTRK